MKVLACWSRKRRAKNKDRAASTCQFPVSLASARRQPMGPSCSPPLHFIPNPTTDLLFIDSEPFDSPLCDSLLLESACIGLHWLCCSCSLAATLQERGQKREPSRHLSSQEHLLASEKRRNDGHRDSFGLSTPLPKRERQPLSWRIVAGNTHRLLGNGAGRKRERTSMIFWCGLFLFYASNLASVRLSRYCRPNSLSSAPGLQTIRFFFCRLRNRPADDWAE